MSDTETAEKETQEVSGNEAGDEKEVKEAGQQTDTKDQQEQETPEQKAAREGEAAKRREGYQKRQREKDERQKAQKLHDAEEAKHKAELEAAELRGRLAALEGKDGKKEEDGPPKKPVALDYENAADFNEAIADYTDKIVEWNRKQMQADLDKRIEEVKKTTTHTAADPEADKKAQLQKRIEEVKGKLEEEFGEDAVDVLLHDKDFSFTATMRDEIFHEKGENAHKILGYLIENPKIADKIAALSPGNQIREIDKLEAALTTKKGSGAPPPLKDVSGKGGGPVDPKKMNDVEWKEHKRKEKLSSA